MKRTSPAAARNKDPILDVLRRVLPGHGTVLEIASGGGEHAIHFARHLPHLAWQPTDPSQDALESIEEWRAEAGLPNLRAPLALDAAADTWPLEHAEAVVCINMIHISPWNACVGLLRGSARVLAPGGLLVTYGPYRRGGAHTAPSNEAFDRDLRARNAAWGVRDLEDVAAEGALHGLALAEVVSMPANNFTLVFRRA